MDLKSIESVYFIGAGGIGMSALVRYFLSIGKRVAGYDRTATRLTSQLISEGAALHFEENVALIPTYCQERATTLVVYTPAIPADHAEYQYFLRQGFTLQKRAEVLGTITRATRGLCIAGTHGKTTTSTMAAHLLHQSHVKCNAFLGGISLNYDTNLLLADNDLVVIEADEFDRSFHHLSPHIAVVTATDADHLDIYGTYEAYLESFRHFTSLVKSGGTLLVRHGLPLQCAQREGISLMTYSQDKGDYHAENIRCGDGEIHFDFVSPRGRVNDVQLGVPVLINVENGIAAMAVAQLCGATDEELRSGMESFRGVERRFQLQCKTPRTAFYTDYAHHPAEIAQCARSMRQLYAGKRLTALFQPHLYTRTRDFYREFAESLSLFDEVVLTDIYPAREAPIPGITSQIIHDNLAPHVEGRLCPKGEVLRWLEEATPEVLILLGAGDLDAYLPEMNAIIERKR